MWQIQKCTPHTALCNSIMYKFQKPEICVLAIVVYLRCCIYLSLHVRGLESIVKIKALKSFSSIEWSLNLNGPRIDF